MHRPILQKPSPPPNRRRCLLPEIGISMATSLPPCPPGCLMEWTLCYTCEDGMGLPAQLCVVQSRPNPGVIPTYFDSFIGVYLCRLWTRVSQI